MRTKKLREISTVICQLKNNSNSNTSQLRHLIDVYQLQQLIDKQTKATASSQASMHFVMTKTEDIKTIDSGAIELV